LSSRTAKYSTVATDGIGALTDIAAEGHTPDHCTWVYKPLHEYLAKAQGDRRA
jgi:hypothetical protein